MCFGGGGGGCTRCIGVAGGSLLRRAGEGVIFSSCNGCGIFLILSVLIVSYVVVVHQRSFYSGIEDEDAVLIIVLV